MIERTLAIIKPDGMAPSVRLDLCDMVHAEGLFRFVSRTVYLRECHAEHFYAEHKGKPFFADLIRHMTSGPCQPMVLSGENVVERFRKALGCADSSKADAGTIRARFGDHGCIYRNAMHGSDSKEAAAREIPFFFAGFELL